MNVLGTLLLVDSTFGAMGSEANRYPPGYRKMARLGVGIDYFSLLYF